MNRNFSLISSRCSGFSLLEVLITLVILGFGLISLARFQGTLTQDSSAARARTVAAHLAEQKVEDLRNFTLLQPPFTPGTGVYSAIISNGGGVLPSGSLSVANANVQYSRNWTVTDYYYSRTLPNTAPSSSIPSPPRGFPDFKKVTVTVAWQDQDGSNQSVILNTIITSSDPAKSGRILQ